MILRLFGGRVWLALSFVALLVMLDTSWGAGCGPTG
jgi:hypothetical protein